MNHLEKPKYDSVIIGTIAGILAPMLAFIIYYLIMYHGMNMAAFLHYLTTGDIFIPVISLCCFCANLPIFFICIWTNRDKSARGVLQATFVYAIYVCIMKVI